MFFVSKSWAADEEIIALLARMAENVSFALDNFDRADEKAKADEQKERLTRMFAALSATNEAIMRAKSRTEMFELVCEAAAQGGRFNSTSILLVRPDSDYLDMVAVAGPTADNARRLKVSISEAVPEGRGVCGTAFRSRQACINNDFPGDPRRRCVSTGHSQPGTKSGAAFPLLVDGQPVGVMLFISSESGHVHRRIRRTAATAGRQCVLCARKFRSRRREGEDRGAERTADANVRGARRHQRSDHAGQVANGAVRTGLRGRDRRRQFHLHGDRAGTAGRRFSGKCRIGRTRSGAGKRGAIVGRCRAAPKGRASPGSRSAHASLASATTIWAISAARGISTRWFATAGPGRARHCRC